MLCAAAAAAAAARRAPGQHPSYSTCPPPVVLPHLHQGQERDAQPSQGRVLHGLAGVMGVGGRGGRQHYSGLGAQGA